MKLLIMAAFLVVACVFAPLASADPACEIETLVMNNGSLGGFAQTENYVYWSESDVSPGMARLLRRPKDGDDFEILVSFPGRAAAVAADRAGDDAIIYYSRMALNSADTDEIWRWDPSTGDDAMVVTDVNRPIGLLPEKDALVWGDQGRPGQGPGVRRLYFADNTTTTLASPFYNVRFLAGDDTDVYFATYFGNGMNPVGKVFRVAKSGGTPKQLAGRQPVFGGITADDDHVYWTTFAQSSFLPPPQRAVSSAAKDGTGYDLLNADDGFHKGIAVSDGQLYWTSQLGGTTLHTMPVTGGTPVVLANSLEFFATNFLVFDAKRQALYFAGDWGSSGNPPHPVAVGTCVLSE